MQHARQQPPQRQPSRTQAAQLQPRIQPPPELKPKYLQEHEQLLEAKLPPRRSDAEPEYPDLSRSVPVASAPVPVSAPVSASAPVVHTPASAPSGPRDPAEAAPKAKAKAKRAKKAETAPAIPVVESPLSDDQRGIIRRYIELDDQISELKIRVKELSQQRADLERLVSATIKPLAAPVKTGNTVLRLKVEQVKESLTKETWVKKLAQSGELKDPSKSQELVDGIYKNRAVTATKEELVRND